MSLDEIARWAKHTVKGKNDPSKRRFIRRNHAVIDERPGSPSELVLKILPQRKALHEAELLEKMRVASPDALVPRVYFVHTIPYSSSEFDTILAMEDLAAGNGQSDICSLSPRKLAIAMSQVAQTLAVAHSFGYVHRDIKPSNLIHNSGQTYVIDWSDAMHEDQMREEDRIVTTPGYFDKHIAINPKRPYSSYPFDLWHLDEFALGKTILAALTNKSAKDLTSDDIHRVYKEGVIGELISMTKYMTSHKEFDRAKSMDQLATDLFAFSRIPEVDNPLIYETPTREQPLAQRVVYGGPTVTMR